MPTRSRYIASFRINSADIVNGTISYEDLGNVYTSNIREDGANVYFSNARAVAAISGNSSAVTFANVTANVFIGNIAGGANNTLLIQTSSNVTGFLPAPSTDFTFLRYDAANGIVWGTVPGANTITYLANSIALDPSYGTYNSGNVLSIRTVGDYNLDANNYYSINETATTPGYIAYIDFTAVQTFNRIAINLFYTQNSSHVIYVDLWNTDTLAWDSFGSYNGLGTYYQFALAVLNPDPYIEANGLVEMRLYHASGGNVSHNHRIDYIALEYSVQGPQGPKGTTGSTGAAGAGVATGGEAGQILYKANSTNYATYWGNLTTSNVVEETNLYFTNTRARAAIVGGTGVTYIEANGQVNIGQDVGRTSDVEFRNVVLTGNLTIQGSTTTINARELSISDNMIYLNQSVTANINAAVGDGTNVIYTTTVNHGYLVNDQVRITGITPANLNQLSYVSILAVTSNTFTIAKADTDTYVSGGTASVKESTNPDIGFAGNYNDGTYHHTGLFRDATDGIYKFYDSYTPEPDANLFIDTAHASFRLANVMAKEFIGVVIGNVSSLDNQTTSNLVEGANLYYTNARVWANVGANIGSLHALIDNLDGNITSLTTSNVAEGSNLYYTDTRVWANVGANIGNLNAWVSSNSANIGNINSWIPSLTTGSIAEGANLYFTNARVRAAISNVAGISYVESTGVLTLTNTGVVAGTYGNANLIPVITVDAQGRISSVSNVQLYSAGGGGATVDSVNGQTGTVVLTTANIAESGNLYFTTDRVWANVGANLGNVNSWLVTTNSNIGNLNSWTSSNSANLGNLNTWVSTNSANIGNLNTWVSTNSANIGNLNAWVATHNAFATTTGVAEGSNLYFTNARVLTAISTQTIANANISGPLVIGGELTIGPVGGDEGAQLNLGQAITNSTLDGDTVTVDIYQNKVRFFEQGGSARGAFIDLTACLPGVGSNLLAGGGGGSPVSSVNGQTGAVVLTTANIAESGNLYYTDNRVWSNVGANIGNINSWIPSLTTASIAEANGNLYYTNARARAAITTAAANAKGLSYVESTGEFSLADSGATAAVYGGASQIPAVVVDRYGRITAASNVALSGSGTVTGFNFTGGIVTVTNPNTVPSLTVAGTSGGVVYFSSSSTWASSGALATSAIVIGGGAGNAPSTTTTGTGVLTAIGNAVNTNGGLVTQSGTLTSSTLLIGGGSGSGISTTTTGTGVLTALGVSVGSSGAFVVNGGALGTPTSGTVTNLTGTASININGTVGATTPAAGQFTSLVASGLFTANTTAEVVTALSGATGVVTHNTALSAVFYHTSPAANFTANFTNVPTTDNRVINVTLVIVQGATPYICNAVQINGAAQTIRWQGGSAPTGTGSRWEVMNFSLIDVGASWVVLGALYTHG